VTRAEMRIAFTLTIGLATRIDGARGAEVALVVHVTDNAHIPPGLLAKAKRYAGSVYSAAGVRVVWRDGFAGTVEPDGAFHVDVLVVPKDMRTGKSQLEGIDGEVFGRALQPIKRVYVFYDRIEDHAMRTRSNLARVLAMVIGHEVGHLLLPAFSHSPTGIMQAHWEGPILHVPAFTVDQARAIRTRLAGASAK
jgi:hypothetical protein